MQAALGSVEELSNDVDRNYKLPSSNADSEAVRVASRRLATLAAWKAAVSDSPSAATPRDLMRGLREFAEQQAESVQEAQREQFATLTLNTAVELTAAALQQIQPQGGVDEQAIALRDAMRVLFPEAVALVSAARQGFMRETP